MDAVRRQVQRRVVPHHSVVGIHAVGEPDESDVLVRSGLLPNEVAEDVPILGHRRTHVGFDGVPETLAPRIGIRHARRLVRVEEGVVRDRLGQPSIDLRDRIVDGKRRRRAVPPNPLEQSVTEVAKVRAHPVDLRDHRVGDGRVRDRQLRHVHGQARDGSEDRIDAELREACLEDVGVAPAIEGDHLASDRILRRELVQWDCLRAGREFSATADLVVLAGTASVVIEVGVLVVAHDVAPGRPDGQEIVEVLLGKGVDVVGHRRDLPGCARVA